MRVNLRGGKTTMPQQLFYCIEVCSVVAKVRGKGVSQYVWAFLFYGGGIATAQCLVYHIVNVFRIEWFPFFAYKQMGRNRVAVKGILIGNVIAYLGNKF